MTTLAILGAGMMGSALAFPLADAGHELRLVGTHLDREIIDALRRDRVHPGLGVELPENVHFFAFEELGQALDGADALALGVSSAGVEWAARALAPYLPASGLTVLMVAKGLRLENDEIVVLPRALLRALPEELRPRVRPVAVAGPCIAGELARRVATCVVFTGDDPAAFEYWRRVASGGYYYVWTSTDLYGVEVCAALKNAYAMGIALGAGMHEARGGAPGSVAMHNLESAVFAQAIFEMARVAEVAGGRRESVFGLPGVGDLDVTCNGGRTGRFGRLLGLGLGREEAIRRMEGATLECLEILDVMRRATAALERKGVLAPGELPLLDELCNVALDGATVELRLDRYFGQRP